MELQKGVRRFSRENMKSCLVDLPLLVQAQELIHFWKQNFKVQVETRSGVLRIHEDDDCKYSKNSLSHLLAYGVAIEN